MSNTPNLELPYILPSQAQKHITHNEAIKALDAIIHLSVINRTNSSPPPAPKEGQRYIIPELATGEWADKDQKIAAWQDGSWSFFTPQQGWMSWIAEEQKTVVFDTAQWRAIDTSVNPASMVGINTTADETNKLAAKSDSILFSHDDVTPGTGDIRHILNKSGINNFATQIYQTGFSARAETGLTGSDDFQLKVSPDGTSWHDAISVDKNTGSVSMPNSTLSGHWHPSRGNDSQTGFASHQVGQELSIARMSAAWMMVYGLPIGVASTIDRLIFRVQTAAIDEIGLALYSSEADDAPGNLIANFGIADCSKVGLKTLTLNSPLNLSPGLYWIAALSSQGEATTRGGNYPRDFGNAGIPANVLIRSGVPFRVNVTTHSIGFWSPPATLSNLETKAGQLDPTGQHCPAIFMQ